MNTDMTRRLILLTIIAGFGLSAYADDNIRVLLQQSDTLLIEGNQSASLQVAESALAVVDRTDQEMVAKVQIAMARARIRLGNLITAEDLLLAASEAVPSDNALQVQIANERGAISSQRGDYDAAITHYRNAVAWSTEVDEGRARMLINLGNALLDGRHEWEILALLDRLEKSLSSTNKSEAAVTNTETLIAAAQLFRRTNKAGFAPRFRLRASELLDKAYSAARDSNDDYQASVALGLQATLYIDESRMAEALRIAEISLLFAQQARAPDAVFRAQGMIGQILLSQGRTADAEAAYANAIEILEEMRRDLPAAAPRIFAEQVMPVYNGYADVLLKKAYKEPDRNRKQELLAAAVGNLEALKQAEVEDYFARQCVVETTQNRSSFLSRTAIVYPVFLDDRTEIVLETEEGHAQFVIPVGRKEMTAMIRRFRVEIEDYNDTTKLYLRTAEILEQWLIDPIEATLARLDVTTLVFVPDGPLRTIPMAALYDGQHFLVERFALASTPAISLTRQAQRKSEARALVAGITEGVQGFAPLAFVGPELDQVSDIVGGNKLKDQSFLLEDVENNFATEQFSVVHFATHGTFSSDFRKSYLLTYDDKLTMGRLEGVLNEQHGLDLLVLSACQTAAGDDRAALGLAGVAIQAGAATALATLWSISDEGTSRLIPEFYRNIYEKGMSKAAGLQEAQVRLLKDPRFQHPVYWAPYLLIGNWT